MTEWAVKHNDGSYVTNENGERVVTRSLEYSGSWMGECFITVSFKSPSPISFSIGDYIEYRGEKFEINYEPGKIKSARRNSYGEAFSYDNVKFNSKQDELARTEFIDIVLADNNVHYTSLTKFSFYVSSLDDILDRIQANLNEQWGDGTWKLYSRNKMRSLQRGCDEREWMKTYGEGIEDNTIDSTSITADGMSCWDALALIKSKFNINFITRGRNVFAGTAGLPTSIIFKYGKGNGLYQIEQNADSEQSVTTRLKAYGSTKNLPSRYYAELNMRSFANITAVRSKGDENNPYVELLLDLDYSINYFYNDFTVGEQKYYYVKAYCEGAIVNARVSSSGDDEKVVLYSEYSADSTDPDDNSDKNAVIAFMNAAKADGNVRFIQGVRSESLPASHKTYITDNLPNNMAIDHLMLPGFPNMSLKEWWDSQTEETKNRIYSGNKTHLFSENKYRPFIDSTNKNEIGIRPNSVYFDTEDIEKGIKEIYPTIEKTEINGVRIDEVLGADTIEDNGVFKGGEEIPNFHIYLKSAIDFDINDLIKRSTETPMISMKDGMCGGRNFQINSAAKQGDGSWELVCQRQKDDTLDLYYPYNDFPVSAGDHFILEGIPLPDSYVEAASIKLLQYALRYLDKNDYTRYVYSPKIDEVFMARQHDNAMADVTGNTVSIHDTIKEGDFFQFEDSDLLIEGNVTIDQLNIKEEEGKIPTYEITLREDKSVGTIQKIQERIDSLESNDNGSTSSMTVPQIQRIVSSYGGRIFLSKTQDDTANGFIKFLKGLQVGNQFVSGLLGEGGVFRKDADGKTYIEADRMYVRMKAYFDNVEIKDYHHAQGNRMVTSTGAKITRVENKGSYYRCYFRASDGDNTISNDFVIGDMAYCNVTNIIGGELFKHIYWRLVIGKDSTPTNDEHYIDLSKVSSNTIGGIEYAGGMARSDEPLAQDNVIQLGNVNDSTRRGAIIEYASGADSPSYKIYQNIGNIGNAVTLSAKRTAQYSLEGKEMVSLGYNSQTAKAYMNVYGDTFIGDHNGSSFIRYNSQNKELEIKAKIEATSTVGNQSLSEYIKSNQNNFDDSELLSAIQGLQEQIDGEIDTWFFNVNPSATTEPELTWKNTDTANNNNAERLKHLGDVYYNNSNGYAWRYSNTGTESNPVFSWREISDSAVIRALTNAAAAQETADSKITIYTSWNAWVVSGSSKLRVKDLFIPTQDTTQGGTTYKANKVYRCTNASTPAFVEVAYTDDTKINSYINEIIHGTATSGSDLIKAAAAQRAIMGALNEGTVVDGGLVLTSLIGLRQKSGNNHIMWAGISGQYNSTPSGQTGYAKGNGIAAWYGGAMVDKEMLTDAQIEEGWNTHRWARSLFRFDGSGYISDGNISWDKDGGMTIQNITSLYDNNKELMNLNRLTELTNIFHTTLGAPNNTLYILPQNAFSEIRIVHPSTYTIEGTDVLNMNEMDDRYLTKEIFYKIFAPVFGTNGDLENLQVRGGLWTNSYISALGQNSSQGGGSGTSYNRLDTWASYDSTKSGWVLSALLGNDLNSRLTTLENGVAPISHTHAWSDITNTPTTLNGYGITDAYISNGVIRLGSQSITPITSHQSLTGYATEDWVGSNYASKNHTHAVIINGVSKTISASGSEAIDLGSYLPLGGGMMSNTNVVTNLNADMLDGYHGSYYAKASDVATLQGYFTSAGSAFNADKVDQYHVAAGGFLFKTIASVEIDTADIEGDYWYIHFRSRAWWHSTIEKVQLSSSYDDVKGVAYIDIPSYNNEFRAFTTTYRGCNILEVAYKPRNDGYIDLYAKMRKPTSAAKATVNLYATFSDGTLEIIDSAPTNVTFTALTPNAPTNVKANTLATPRTIWGQSFDGSANVSGNMSNVGNINSNVATDWTFSKLGEPIFKIANTGNVISPWDKTNGFIALRTGNNTDFSGAKEIRLLGNGNVGIGTNNPSYKLDVNGTLHASNLLTSALDGAYLKIGNVYLMYDAANNAIKVCGPNNTAANFYALGGVSALGYGVDGGGGGSNYDRLDAWENYDSTKNGWVLSALLGNDLHTNVASLTSRVRALEDGQIQGIATQDWVEQQGYLTSLAHIHTLTIGSTTKSVSANGTQSFSLSEIGAAASGHTHSVKINGTTKTITSGTTVDLGTYLTAHQSLADYATKTWVEQKGYLTNHQDISGKADKATTLAGYGIIDAYISNGAITLGTNTITPITSLAGYATETWVGNNYLGLHAKADDSDKLDGYDSSHFANAADVVTLQSYFVSGIANNADKLDGYEADDFLRYACASYKQGWYKIADCTISGNVERAIVFDVLRPHTSNHHHAILSIHRRAGGTPQMEFAYNNGFNATNFRLYYSDNVMELYVYVEVAWGGGIVMRAISETGEVTQQRSAWNLYNRYPSDPVDVGGELTTYITPVMVGRVYAAEKLYTARTLWGNTFDGTGNISNNIQLSVGDQINYQGGVNDGLAINYDSGNHGTQSTRFFNGTGGEVMRIAGNGNVGISVSNPTDKLDVAGNIKVYGSLNLRSAGNAQQSSQYGRIYACSDVYHSIVLAADISGTSSLSYSPANVTTFGEWGGLWRFRKTTTSENTLLVELGATSTFYGTIHATAGIYSEGYVSALGQNTSSDARLKDVQGDVDLPIDMLANAPSKAFTWKENKALGEQVGTIAQYWQKHLPQVVHDNNGYLAMQYDVAALLGVISLAKNVKSHEERIAELERENKELKKELKELKYERN